MLKISDAVKHVAQKSNFVEVALFNNFLNLTEYARFIRKEIATLTKKQVTISAIVIALSRLKKQLSANSQLQTSFTISDLSIKSPLCEIVYEKTEETLSALKKIYDNYVAKNTFLNITQSNSEIMITASENLKEAILKVFNGLKPIIVLEGLVGITVRFSSDVINQPNVLYTFLKSISFKKINIIDIISTYTELTFVVRKEDTKEAFDIINMLV